MSLLGVRREKAALSSGVRSCPRAGCGSWIRKVSNTSYTVERMDFFGGVGFPGVCHRAGLRPDPVAPPSCGRLAVWRELRNRLEPTAPNYFSRKFRSRRLSSSTILIPSPLVISNLGSSVGAARVSSRTIPRTVSTTSRGLLLAMI